MISVGERVDRLFSLEGRVALVTGGSRGLGHEMSLAFAQAGADLIVASRNLDACITTCREVEALGRHALPVRCHVGRWDDIDGLVSAAYSQFSAIDVLVNSAGMSPRYGQPSEMSETLFDKVLAVNLKGPLRLGVLIGERMAARGSGSIVNISSTVAVRTRPDVLPYAAAKAGLLAITEGLAHHLGPAVRVNAIMAGYFATDVSSHWDRSVFDRAKASLALRRVAEPIEIVGTALYLASDASTYTTGVYVRVDGGGP